MDDAEPKRKRKPKRPRPDLMPGIPDTPENIALAVLNTPPKKKWDYMDNPPTMIEAKSRKPNKTRTKLKGS